MKRTRVEIRVKRGGSKRKRQNRKEKIEECDKEEVERKGKERRREEKRDDDDDDGGGGNIIRNSCNILMQWMCPHYAFSLTLRNVARSLMTNEGSFLIPSCMILV